MTDGHWRGKAQQLIRVIRQRRCCGVASRKHHPVGVELTTKRRQAHEWDAKGLSQGYMVRPLGIFQ
jgi:hypothetical protein